MNNIIRILRGSLSQKELAEKVGMTQEAISRYESGRFPKQEVLNKIAEAVGKRIEWVIKDREGKEK